MSGGASRRGAVVLGALFGVAACGASSSHGETLLLAQGKQQALPVALEIRLVERSVAEAWDATFEALGQFFDRNGDGRLDRAEAARLPSPFALRQMLWGQFALDFDIGRQAPELKEGETISFDELAAHYRKHGVGDAIVATGRVAATEFLNEALTMRLDRNENRTIEADEWRETAKVLVPLDLNDDELIGPGELDRRVPSYPGTSGTVLVKPQATPKKPGTEPATFLLTAGEKIDAIHPLATRRNLTLMLPEESYGAGADSALREKETSNRAQPATFAIEGMEVRARTERGLLPARVRELETTSTTWFDRLDANRDGTITPEEADGTQIAAYRRLSAVADRNDDRRLTRAEHDAWLDLERQVAEAQVLVTVIDFGRSWFEQLDADHDGGLSAREIRTAEARLATIGKSPQRDPPRVLSITVSRGHPRSLLSSGSRGGPSWFAAMDRNGDGDVSRREWLLEAEAFDKYDADRDGLVSADEASAAAKR